MKNVIILALVFASAVSVTVAQETATPAPVSSNSILVYVEGGKKMSLKAADLAKLPRKEIRAKDHDGKDLSYSGVELREVLKLVDAPFGDKLRGKAIGLYLLVWAADDYKATFALAELDNTFTDKIVILADTENGKPLDLKDGPWQIIVPDEKKHARWVRQVVALWVTEGRSPVKVF